jgi:ABC-type multidrug transport system ATPase subunit
MAAALETRELSRFYGEYCALAPANLSVPEREIVVLSGRNGAGKSTLLLCLGGLLRPSRGNVLTCTNRKWKPGGAWPSCPMCRASISS